MPDGARFRRVVINADDFGLHPAVNDGVVRSHRDGVVTSTSLMACGQAFEDAVARVAQCPALGVGVHLTLVEERPVSDAGNVRSLVDRAGCLPRSYREFALGWVTGRLRPSEVRRELDAQIRRVLDAGIRPTHLDSHQHVHCLPGVWSIVTGLARRYQVPFLRAPRFDALRTPGAWSMVMLRVGVNVLARLRRPAAVRRADAMRGLSVSGRMRTETLMALLAGAPDGLTEIMVHPGTDNRALGSRYHEGPWRGFNWEGELSALTDARVRAACRDHGVRLTHFGCA